MRSAAHWFRHVLGRETAAGRAFVPQVDGLRCVAIGLVLARHTAEEYFAQIGPAGVRLSAHGGSLLNAVALNGWVGVQVFFAISGYVLALPFARHHLAAGRPVQLSAYYVRRVTRIEPPFVINLLVLYLLFVTVYRTPTHTPLWLFGHLLVTLTYTHSDVFGTLSPISGVAWSLEVEVQFYLIAPLVMQLFRLRPAAVRRGVIVALVVLFAYLRPFLGGMVQGATLAHQLPYFLVGLLVADLYLTDWHRPARWPLAWDAAATAAGLALVAPPFPVPGLGRVNLVYYVYRLAPPEVFVLCAAAFRGRLWRHALGWTPVYLIGGMCYTIYLYHWNVMHAVLTRTAGLQVGHNYSVNLLVQTSIAAAAIVVASAVLFVLFEKPFMRRDWPAAVAHRARTLARRRPSAPIAS